MAVTVVYDGRCGICRRFQRVVDRADRANRIDWQNMHDTDYADLPVDQEDCVQAMQVIDDGTVYPGYDGVRRICRIIPILRPLYIVFSLPGIHYIGHRVYRYVAAHRHCAISPG